MISEIPQPATFPAIWSFPTQAARKPIPPRSRGSPLLPGKSTSPRSNPSPPPTQPPRRGPTPGRSPASASASVSDRPSRSVPLIGPRLPYPSLTLSIPPGIRWCCVRALGWCIGDVDRRLRACARRAELLALISGTEWFDRK